MPLPYTNLSADYTENSPPPIISNFVTNNNLYNTHNNIDKNTNNDLPNTSITRNTPFLINKDYSNNGNVP